MKKLGSAGREKKFQQTISGKLLLCLRVLTTKMGHETRYLLTLYTRFFKSSLKIGSLAQWRRKNIRVGRKN